MIEEVLGAITVPAKHISPLVIRPPVRLARHPSTGDCVAPCGTCGRPGFGYTHPDPLRPGVVLWRCAHHYYPGQVRDDPKAAPGGGVYR